MDILSAINGAVASTTQTITSALTTNMGPVLEIFGGLVALGLVLGLVTAYIHKKAGSRK